MQNNKPNPKLNPKLNPKQDNEPLMRSLSKLVNLNNPDLVLFVGEALVGNDSIDQVPKFNKCS
jgi:signal recognition particle receptor subunit alpha